MSVTVVGRWHVEAGREDQIVQTVRQELGTHTGAPRARRTAQLFQALDDERQLLYVGEWEDCAVFEQYRGEAADGTVEAAIRDQGEFLICERLLFFGNYAYRAQVTGCAIFEAPPDVGDQVRELLTPNGRWIAHGSPGLVHYAVYREVTHQRRWVLVHGWQTEAGLLALRQRRQILREALEAIGGSVVQFTCRERASTDFL